MKKVHSLIFIFLIFGIYCCQDIFEEDITDKEVFLLAPSDSVSSTIFEHTFRWEPVEGATNYEFQLVSPSFDYIENYILDTNLSSERFDYTLYPDTFQWAVRAYNGSSSTDYFAYTLIIDSSNVIGDISLVSPVPNYVTNDSSIQFKWLEHIFADYYIIRIDLDEAIFALGTVDDGVTYSIPNDNYTEIVEGSYQWQVTGFNDNSDGSSGYRSFIVDWTAPGKPILQSPANNDTVSQANLSWRHSVLGGSQISDSLFIYADTIINTPTSYFFDDTSFTFEGAEGNYFWKVKSIDEAGNEGDFSEVRKFVIKDEE